MTLLSFRRRRTAPPFPLRLVTLAFGLLVLLSSAAAQSYTSIVVFGDSLSDTGNDAAISRAMFTVNAQVPGPATGYTDGRFTDGLDTSPAARLYTGVWVEQLAAKLAAKPPVVASLNGGTDYAYGFATTNTGTSTFAYGPGNAFVFQAANMGQQVATYLATKPVITSKTLFVVWGGANDLLAATSSSDITNAATRELGIVQQLVSAGATDILLVNLPPLGLVPRLNGSPATSVPGTASAQGFDQALAAGYASLLTAYAGKINLRLLDVYTLFNTIVGPPMYPGFANVTASSQGNTAVNPDTYLFWDDLHPTTYGHSLIAAAALTDLGAPVGTTTALTTSNSNANLGTAVTVTANVTGTAGTPVGTVTFYDGTTMIGSALLHGSSTTATASVSTSTLTAGVHSLSASFAGVNGYVSSTSTAVSETVVAPGYSASVAPSSLTVVRGATGTATITIVPVGGLAGTFTLACGSLPFHVACAFGQTSIAVSSAAPVSTTVSVITGGTAMNHAPGLLPNGPAPATWALLGLPLVGGLALRRQLRGRMASLGLGCLLLLAGAGLVGGLTGCGNGDAYKNDVASGTYQVPLILTAPTGQTSTTLMLNVTVQ